MLPVLLSWLEWMVDLPWGEVTEDRLDVEASMAQLNRDHHGLDKVKDRIVEYLAVRQLRGDMKGPIMCLAGPPGVGKTSLGVSIADSMNRKFNRISLGGVHDEAEIRGHRKSIVLMIKTNQSASFSCRHKPALKLVVIVLI